MVRRVGRGRGGWMGVLGLKERVCVCVQYVESRYDTIYEVRSPAPFRSVSWAG